MVTHILRLKWPEVAVVSMLQVNRFVRQLLSFTECDEFAKDPLAFGQMRFERAKVFHFRLAGSCLPGILHKKFWACSALGSPRKESQEVGGGDLVEAILLMEIDDEFLHRNEYT